ncbi:MULTISPECIES: outer membrane protein assembly factor BamD [Amniculibacterium]|uniref:outer membrane protein assembly factor BamD n=1 Tax=Amniculibacterium TaxID=2715289 RepID=UPI000F594499|nr:MULTISPECIES: outer membrane protein assembly factor BamD [Amniculibacterium]
MKKYIMVIFAAFTLTACSRDQEKAMKSADKNFILKVANEKFAKKKWRDALSLYDRLSNLVAGTDDYPNVLYNQAYANYYDKAYRIAGAQFKSFTVNFPKDPRKEETAYMSALCYYQGSMEYNLDQSSTKSAINELQDFLNTYPNSEKSKNISSLIDELSYKLEFKAYESARQYYKMGEYKAASVTFENVLDDFPSTKLRPQIYDYILKSKYELAINSIYDLKEERLKSALAFAKTVEKEFPNTDLAKTAVSTTEKLTKESEKFAQLQKDVEKRRAALTEKQKKLADNEAEKLKTEQQLRDQMSAEKRAQQTLRDSAKIATPAPNVTLPIKK